MIESVDLPFVDVALTPFPVITPTDSGSGLVDLLMT
jgi:hypothetical protein